MFRFCLLVGVLFLLSKVSFAQRGNCAENLEEARQKFERGHLYSIPATLKSCLDNGFNKTQRIEAYLILTRTYLLIDDPISAEDSYLKLLGEDPEYDIDQQNDPVDIVYLSSKFTTTPIFIFFAKVGINSTGANSIGNYGVDNTTLSNESYSNLFGINIGGGLELNFNDHLSLGLELMLASRNYSYENKLFNGDFQELIERQTQIEAPFYFKYRAHFKKWHPFVYGGISFNYLLTSNGEVSLIDRFQTGEGDLSEFTVTGPEENLLKMRNTFTLSGIVGIGTSYRVGYNYVFADIRYNYGLNNIVNTENQYSNNTLLYKYGYVDDFKTLSSINVAFGFVWPIYKPRKIDSKKGFLSKLIR